jgi:hypothetical protein
LHLADQIAILQATGAHACMNMAASIDPSPFGQHNHRIDTVHTKSAILERMALFRLPGGGIGSWLTETTSPAVFERLGSIDDDPLSGVQLNQLLVLAHEAPVSDGFFHYYWLELPPSHPYNVRDLPSFDPSFIADEPIIRSLNHLSWGLYRLYVDALLYFGNVRTAFRALRNHTLPELRAYFSGKRFDCEAIKRRGPAMPLRPIAKDRRYLIAEMACKSYGDHALEDSQLRSGLLTAYKNSVRSGAPSTTVQALLKEHLPEDLLAQRDALTFSASEILDRTISSDSDVIVHYESVAERFRETRADAVKNTEFYLSMITDLDVYVATSMREPAHFVTMAEVCAVVFNDLRLAGMNIRYFDPTLSAANGHEDKGLIECLMVKCAKALVYCAGERESYGKDAEAAMALSLGKPVIFYCEKKAQFYRDVHPLTRLIQFETGIAVGAIVTDRLEHVAELLQRTFENRMEYRLTRSSSGSLRLVESLTASVVRLQTSDQLVSETFWNHYHQDRDRRTTMTPEATSKASVTLVRPRPVKTAPISQPNLPLDTVEPPLPVAARASSPGTAGDKTAPQAPARPRTGGVGQQPLQMSAEEVFNGISSVPSTTSTGKKRREVFVAWLAKEAIPLPDAARLLRFIETTLVKHETRVTLVYKAGDLTQWYREMSNGEAFGSKP